MALGDIFPNSVIYYNIGVETDCGCDQYQQVQVLAGEGTADQSIIDALNAILEELNTQTEVLSPE